MVDPKYDVGEMVELVPDAFEDNLYEGKGLILSCEDGIYLLQMFEFRKISRKNFSVVDLGPQRIRLLIDKADEKGYFKII